MNQKAYLAGYLEKQSIDAPELDSTMGDPLPTVKSEGIVQKLRNYLSNLFAKKGTPVSPTTSPIPTVIPTEGSLVGNLMKAYGKMPLSGKLAVPALAAGGLAAAGITGLGYYNRPKDVSQFPSVDEEDEDNSSKLQALIRKYKGMI